MTEQVVVKNLYKIFGPNPQRAFALIDEGLGKDEIFSRTKLTVGVQDASFTVNKGAISIEDLRKAIRNDEKDIGGLFLNGIKPVPVDTPLQNILRLVREYPCPVPVVDEDNIYQGVGAVRK